MDDAEELIDKLAASEATAEESGMDGILDLDDGSEELKEEAKPEPKEEAKPEPKERAKPEPKEEAKPEPKEEAKPEPKEEAKAITLEKAQREAKALFSSFEALGSIGLAISGGQAGAARIDDEIKNDSIRDLSEFLFFEQKSIGLEKIFLILAIGKALGNLGMNVYTNVKETRAGVSQTSYDKKRNLDSSKAPIGKPISIGGNSLPQKGFQDFGIQTDGPTDVEMTMWDFSTDENGLYIFRPAKRLRPAHEKGLPSMIEVSERKEKPSRFVQGLKNSGLSDSAIALKIKATR